MFLKNKESKQSFWARYVAWRLENVVNSGSVERIVSVLETFVTSLPMSLKTIDATVVARGFLLALEKGDGNAASRISWALKKRPPAYASTAQERHFVSYILSNVTKQPPFGVEEGALLGLVADGYSVKPDILLAVAVHLSEQSQGMQGNLLAKVARNLKREKFERMERSARPVSEHQKRAVSRSA